MVQRRNEKSIFTSRRFIAEYITIYPWGYCCLHSDLCGLSEILSADSVSFDLAEEELCQSWFLGWRKAGILARHKMSIRLRIIWFQYEKKLFSGRKSGMKIPWAEIQVTRCCLCIRFLREQYEKTFHRIKNLPLSFVLFHFTMTERKKLSAIQT